ncbi:hypothetical protein BOX15_Mlig015729g1 [Macrostomum lignano]|uniref:C-type lectin domain-containing protein n=1 Tax=Macrostomum lignano TaxID=282301 RepID=A0A267GBF0_9PLAT|nr:hypothetical protein BOX15_Mlig015729g1 [Macrostomum lignano]
MASFATIFVVALSLTGCVVLTSACPEAQGWYRASTTQLCYKCLRDEKLTFTAAQRRCNSLRSNLLQFQPGDSKAIFDDLKLEFYRTRNTSEFREMAWVGLTDITSVGQYVFLNGFQLNQIAKCWQQQSPDIQRPLPEHPAAAYLLRAGGWH